MSADKSLTEDEARRLHDKAQTKRLAIQQALENAQFQEGEALKHLIKIQKVNRATENEKRLQSEANAKAQQTKLADLEQKKRSIKPSIAPPNSYESKMRRKLLVLSPEFQIVNTQKSLNEIMSFDHVIRVDDKGNITDEHNIYAPDLLDGELDSSKWEFFSTGYTGQDSYNGPIMHDSEYIAGRLEEDIRDMPGVYVAIISYYTDQDDEEGELLLEGWAVVKLKEN